MVTSNRNYYSSPGRLEVAIGTTWSNDYISFGLTQIVDMDQNDTCWFQLNSLSSGTVRFYGGADWSRFAGILLS
jgi:hypothetical protein